jgi:hypothetical protein
MLFAHSVQPSAKRFQFFEQIEHQRCSSAIDTQITLQCHCHPDPAQTCAAETPAAGFVSDGLDDPLVHELKELFGTQLARAAEIGKRQLDLVLEHFA